MGEPSFVRVLLAAEALGALLGSAWWAHLASRQRLVFLEHIAEYEGAMLLPPLPLLEQAPWLVVHRLSFVQGVVLSSVLGAVVGLCEGLSRRGRDPLAGFRLTWWTVAMLGLVLVPGGAMGLLLWPWPLPRLWVAVALAGWGFVVSYGLGRGRPLLH